MQQPTRPELLFVIIDDDPLSVFLSRNAIQNARPEAVIIDFTEASKGLDFIREVSASAEARQLLVFLDLNMPVMDGRQFLEEFAKFVEAVRDQIKIAILSSSISEKDTSLAASNKNVMLFISKPLTAESVTTALDKAGC